MSRPLGPGGMTDLFHDPDQLPLLPYGTNPPTSGWSGSDTSRERAEHDDTTGTTRQRQALTLTSLRDSGPNGLTWKELGDARHWHHGQASGVLSVLHKEGRIARLAERRNKCEVYVLPEHVDGRDTKPHGRKRPTLTDDEQRVLDALTKAVDRTSNADPHHPVNHTVTMPLHAAVTLRDALTRLA